MSESKPTARGRFIQSYLSRSGILGKAALTEDGFEFGGHRHWALRCACGEDGCAGWAMVSAEGLSHHMKFYAPEDELWPPGGLEAHKAA